jgi:uncharacterized protein YjbI with pentapeptide repeats
MDGNQLNQRYVLGDRSFQNLDLSGAELGGIDLRDADFRGSDLYGAKLMDSLLNRVNFSDSTNLAYADLSGADLSEANLSGANLEGANLEGAIAQGAIYDRNTTFPVSFKPEAAGMIRAEDRDRESRVAQTEFLKSQPASAPLQDLAHLPLFGEASRELECSKIGARERRGCNHYRHKGRESRPSGDCGRIDR